MKAENTGVIYVNLDPKGEQPRDVQMDVVLPAGFDFVSQKKGAGVEHSLGVNDVEGAATPTRRFVFSDNGGALLPTGTVLEITIKDLGGEGHELGAEFDAEAINVILSANIMGPNPDPEHEGEMIAVGVKDYKFASIPFSLKIIEDAIHLYEDYADESASQIYAYEGNIRIHRSLKPNQWNTIALPFAMTSEQMMETFGEDVQVADFTGVELEGSSLSFNFASVNPAAIEAHHPYIIKTSSIGNIDAETGFKAMNVEMTTVADEAEDVCVNLDDLDYFQGTYREITISSYYKSKRDYAYYAYLSNNKFYYLQKGGTATVKGFRGYFNIDCLQDYMDIAEGGANLAFFVDDDLITGIDGVTTTSTIEGVYDIQGRKVSDDLSTLKKGVYIINGKKMVVK